MKTFTKIPLYLGLFVFVAAVLFSAIKVGEKGNLTSQRTRASTDNAMLELKFTSPDLVTVVLNSGKDVSGVDVAVKFDKSKIKILPSTLRSGSSFLTSGGVIDDNAGVFSFSALSRETMSKGIVGSFNIVPSGNLKTADSELSIVLGSDGSQVLDRASSQNILNSSSSVKVNIYSK